MKKIKSLASLLVASSLVFSSVGNTFACTALMVADANGNGYYGRTMELPYTLPIPSNLKPICLLQLKWSL